MKLKEKTILFLATGGNIGQIPWAPGTFASVGGLFLAYLLSQIPLPVAVVGLLAIIFFSIGVSGEAEKILGMKDPRCIVIDEIAGMAVTMVGLSFTPLSVILGFFFFRGFDILKPPPISTLQNRLRGGMGIVLDDVAAGIAANIFLRLLLGVIGG